MASKIAGLDVNKLNAVNGPGGDAKASIIDKEDVNNMRQYNVETEKQNTFFGDYNQQKKILNQQLQEQKANQEAVAKSLRAEFGLMGATATEYNKIKKQRIELEAEFAATDKLDIQRRIQLKAQIDAVKISEGKLADQLKSVNSNFIDQSQQLAQVEAELAATEKQLAKLGSG